MADTNLQLRAECSICGKQHVVHGTQLVSHGYTLQYGFKTGTCAGTGKPHFGTQAGFDSLLRYVAVLNRRAANLEDSKEVGIKQHKINLAQAAQLRAEVRFQIRRLDRWTLNDPVLVNVEVVAAEQRIAREAANAEKAAEKAKASVKRQAILAERQAKTAAKWLVLCAENLHQILFKNEVILEWISDYSDREELERDHYKRTAALLAERYPDMQERFNAGWSVTHKIRDRATNKQMHKF